ncbi:NAD-dependent protein deacylase [Arcanobacterium hippocoleae]
MNPESASASDLRGSRRLREFAQMIQKAQRIVFFGGAGVSTASGIPDFRSAAGIYTADSGGHSPEYLLSHTCLEEHPEDFFEFYRAKMLYPDAQPNAAHRYLAQLEKSEKLSAVVTQNIDGLHQKAGSRNVFELHGTVLHNHCAFGHHYPLSWLLNTAGVPHCPHDGTVVRPDVVLYEEALPEAAFHGGAAAIREADLLIIGGTSLNVYPAAGMIHYFQGSEIVLINRDATEADRFAALVFRESIADVFTAVNANIDANIKY